MSVRMRALYAPAALRNFKGLLWEVLADRGTHEEAPAPSAMQGDEYDAAWGASTALPPMPNPVPFPMPPPPASSRVAVLWGDDALFAVESALPTEQLVRHQALESLHGGSISIIFAPPHPYRLRHQAAQPAGIGHAGIGHAGIGHTGIGTVASGLASESRGHT